jgi:membrane associated rhomboid family serine protease
MIPLRDDNYSWSFPIVTILLIAINALVFFLTFFKGETDHIRAVYTFGMIPAELLRNQDITFITDKSFGSLHITHIPAFATIFTSMFMHGDIMHIVGNMWFLWLFGDNVEDRMGKFRFILFYLITGVVAAISHALVASGSVIPTVGASGAISGILGAYFVLFPRANIQTLIFFFFISIIRIPAITFIGLWFLGQMLNGFFSLGYQGAGIAFFAHIGGFIVGVILARLFAHQNLLQVPRHHAKRDPWDDYFKTDYHDKWY